MSIEQSEMAKAVQAVQNGRDRIVLDVPEWEETPCAGVLYSAPYTIKDDQVMGRFIRADDSAGFVEILIRKCELADGSKAFTKADKPILVRSDASVIKRLAMAIVASVTVEDAAEN